MATTILVNEMIKAGEELVKALDSRGVDVPSAFWFYDPEAEEWRLILGMPLVDEQGTAKAYEVIRAALAAAGPPSLFLRQISAVSPNNELVVLVRESRPTEPGIHHIRVGRSTIGTVPIEDLFIYRSCST